MYGVLWKSSTKTDLVKYLAKTAGGLALGMKGGKIGAVIGVAQFGMKLAGNFINPKSGEPADDSDNPLW